MPDDANNTPTQLFCIKSDQIKQQNNQTECALKRFELVCIDAEVLGRCAWRFDLSGQSVIVDRCV